MTATLTNLGLVIDVLADMKLRGIFSDYAIGGAVAAVLHDEPISTVDLDIFFFFTKPQNTLILSLEEIYDYAKERDFRYDGDFIYIHNWLVQFVQASDRPLWKEAVGTAVVKQIDGREIGVIDPEHLAAMWIMAGRKKDFRKLETFDESKIMNAEKLRDVLERFDLLEQWRSKQSEFSSEYRF